MEKYEVKNVTQASEIKNAYETAIAENKEFYRTISNTGKVYGWVDGKHVLANNNNAVIIDGEYWFKNPQYVAPVEEIVEQTEEEIIEEVCDTMEEMVEETKEEKELEVDYKSLYEDAKEISVALIKERDEVKADLELVKKQFADYKAVVEAFKNL